MNPARIRELVRKLLAQSDLPEQARAIAETLLAELGEALLPEATTPDGKISQEEVDELRQEVKAVAKIAKLIEKARQPSPKEVAKQLLLKVRRDPGTRTPPLGRPFGRGAPREKSEDDPRLRAEATKLMKKISEASKRRRGGV